MPVSPVAVAVPLDPEVSYSALPEALLGRGRKINK